MRAAALGAVVVLVLVPGSAVPEGTSPGTLSGEVRTYTVARGETLRSIGARFGIDHTTLASDNGLGPRARLAIGQVLAIDNRHIVPAEAGSVPLVINVPQRMAYLASAAGLEAFPVAVGRTDWQTPVGPFTIVTAEENPTWDVPVSIQEEARREGRSLPARVPPGPDNPLGRFWLGLSISGLGIHGTNARTSIYGVVTHGCIRMHPDDIAHVFERVGVGSTGLIIYEPILLAEAEGTVYLEAHPDAYSRAPEARAAARTLAAALGLAGLVDWERADRVIAAREGIARPVGRSRPDN